MNRQIKFRGKRADNGEWVYGDLLQIAGGCCIYFGSKTETLTPDIPEDSNVFVELMDSECAVVIPDTVGQFVVKTPETLDKLKLRSRDLKYLEIYEDDIVEARCKFLHTNGTSGRPIKAGEQFVVTHTSVGFCAVPIALFEAWEAHGRNPHSHWILNDYSLYINHLELIPVGNIHDNQEYKNK